MINFDFDIAVSKIRELYPNLTSNLTFVNVKSWEESKRPILEWFKNSKTLSSLSEGYIAIQTIESNGSIFEAESDTGLVLFGVDDCISFTHDETDKRKAQNKYFTLFHETAHSIYKHAYTEKHQRMFDTTAHEALCDSFAAALGRELGLFDDKYIKDLSNYRAKNMWIKQDIEHYTSPSLDTLPASFNLKTLPQDINEHVNKALLTEDDYEDLLNIVAMSDMHKETKNEIGSISKLFNSESAVIRKTGRKVAQSLNF